MTKMASSGSALQVGDILAEFFAKRIKETEETKPNDKDVEGVEAETSDSSDSDSDRNSQFSEKRKKKNKRKKHKHKKVKKKVKSRHSSKHRHKHKSYKRKHAHDESKEAHRHKKYKSEEYKEATGKEDEATLPILSSPSYSTEILGTAEYLRDGNTMLHDTYSCQQANREQKTKDHFSLQIVDTKESYKVENLIAAQNDHKCDDSLNCETSRTGEQVNYSECVVLKSRCDDSSCIDDIAGPKNVANGSESASSSAPTTSVSSIVTEISESTLSETVPNSVNSKTKVASNSLMAGSKSRGKIIIKDLSCCQILQKVSEKEREKLDSLEEGEITSEEESDKPKEESHSSETPEEDVSLYNSDILKEKKYKRKKERHKHKKKKKSSRKNLRRSRSIENERHHRHDRRHLKTERPRSSSLDREPYDLREKIDKARLLKVAQRNVLMMIEQGTLPKGVKVDTLKQEQLLSMKTGGKSVQELTEFCRTLSQKEQDDSSSDASQDKWNEEGDTPFIHHPFKLREHHPIIKLNIKNAVQLPTKSPAEKVADAAARLRTQFPVSSGSQHRIKELQWVPVEKDEKQASKQVMTPVTVASNNSSPAVTNPTVIETKAQIPVPTVDVYSRPYTAVPTAYVQPMQQNRNLQNQDYDLSTIVAQRLSAVRRLQENRNDVEALNQLYRVQQKMQQWVQSKQLPGQFTGNTDVRMLSPEELCGPVPVWAKKDQFTRAMPVTEGIGMHLLRKMGWNPGEGLGKNKEGVLEPLLPDIKMDKRGLISDADLSKKILPQPVRKDLSGKHPVSVLMELCSKRKWGMPMFDLIDENGPDHKKAFLFKVKVNNVEYQPTCSSPNKKHAKAQAATVCLQALGLLPWNLNNPL